MRTARIAVGLVLAGMLASPAAVGFQTGIEIGLMMSPSYSDYMDLVYEDFSGGDVWLDLGVNGKADLGDHFAVVPAVDLYLNYATYGDEQEVNFLIVPAVNLRYSLQPENTFYVQAGPSINVASGGGPLAEFEGVGVGGGVMLGYAFAGGGELELGYNYIPVDVTEKGFSGSVTKDFGGPFLRVGLRF
jgi:hypothetical protein